MIESIHEEERTNDFFEAFVERQQQATREIEPQYVERVKEKFSALDEDLEKSGFENARQLFREEEFRYLGLLEKKDSLTLDHSIGVVRVLLQELPEFKNDLQEEMQKEGINFETLLSAAALHDIGKIGLPDHILKSTKKNIDLKNMLEQELNNADPFIEKRLHENGILENGVSLTEIPKEMQHVFLLDAREYLSLAVVFQNEPEALEECEAYGFDVNETSFMDVLRTHEEYSQRLVEGMESLEDHGEIAHLVGTHHNYKNSNESKLGISSEILRISEFASELLHLADVFHAVMQERPYQQKTSEVKALSIIREQTEKGVFVEAIAKRWIKRALETLPAEEGKKDPDLLASLQEYVRPS